MNRHERRAKESNLRRAEKNRAGIALLAVTLWMQAKAGIMSRKAARRRLDAETVRRFGKFKADLMAPRLPTVKS